MREQERRSGPGKPCLSGPSSTEAQNAFEKSSCRLKISGSWFLLLGTE